MSGTHQTPNNPSHSTFRRTNALDQTKQLLLRGLQDGEDVLVQPPPTVHPEGLIPELVASNDSRSVYVAPTKRQLARIEQRFNDYGVSTQRVRSQYDLCDSYSGTRGDDVEVRVKDHIKRGATLGNLHANEELPCQPGCPFGGRNPPKYTEQVVLANPRHIHMDRILEDRHVFTCSLRGDAYITKIDNPPKALDSYIDTNTDFTGYRDFMRNRDTSRPPFPPFLSNYPFNSFEPSDPDEEFGYDIDQDGHHLAPLAVFGLLLSKELPNGWETSYHRRKSGFGNLKPTYQVNLGPNPFEIVGLSYKRHRVVREPGESPKDDTLYILKVPDYSKAKSVVALDIAPTPWMWNLYYGTDFDHQRVYSDDETAEFLRNEMGVDVIQTATSRKPYEGSNVTPGRDVSIAVWATAEFGKPPIVVSTKNALGQYRSNQPNLLMTDAKAGIQYRRGGSVINENEPLVILNGSPRPPNKEFQLWGTLAGKSVPASPNQPGSFGRAGTEIRHQFCESRVGKWATRFDHRDVVVVLNTTSVPEWLQDSRLVAHESPTNVFPDNAPGRRAVARYLRDEAGTQVTMNDIQTEANVSENTARRTRDSLIEQGWVAKHPTEGREPTEYSWVT
jgi:hypothetical protein